MATQIQTMPAPLMMPNASSGNIFTQVMRLFIQPAAFFRTIPSNSQWLWVALLVMFITGYTATVQTQSTGSGSSTSGQSSSAFSLSLLDESSTSTTQPTAQQSSSSTSGTTTDSDTTLMNGLVAAAGVVLMWAGQAMVLSLVSMLRGYAPRLGKNLQIAIWASLPLALMLVLRYIHYASGGTGGSLGLSLLLDNWTAYGTLPTFVQRVLAVLLSNVTLFWLWNLVLLYLGARCALQGRRLTVLPVILMWIIVATVVPALVSEPQTRVSATFPTTTQTQSTTSQSGTSTTTTTGQGDGTFSDDGQFPSSGGQFPGGGGSPPSGGGGPRGG